MKEISKSANRRSLAAIITLRLALASLFVVLVQILIITIVTKLNETGLVRNFVYWETRLLLGGLKEDSSGLTFHLPKNAAYYVEAPDPAYAFRITSGDGQMIAGSNTQLLSEVSPWPSTESHRPDLWLRLLGQEQWLHVAGGERLQANDKEVFIEVATLGDPAGAHWKDVAFEITEDVLIPTLPLIALLLVVATTSIHWSLRSLVKAAEQAETVTESERHKRFDLADMPREAASFASAINRLLDRISNLIESQKLLIARAAHELRTPLAIMLLELGKIGDERARRLEGDVSKMNEAVDRLLTLARLNAVDKPVREEIDLKVLINDIIDRMQPYADGTGHELNLHAEAADCRMLGDVEAVREAIRNVIENAVKHTPPRTKVDVTLSPSLVITVEDSGPGLINLNRQELFQPFRKGRTGSEGWGLGLAIAQQAVELHHGSIEFSRSETGGARFTLKFGRSAARNQAAD